MRKIIYIISLCMAVGLAACGTSGKQAKTKSQQAEFVKDPLTPEPVSYTHLTLPTSDLV